MSLGNDPSNIAPPIEYAEAVAGAREARAFLKQDGPAPSVASILEEMGRDRTGAPLEDGPVDITAHEAARRALGLTEES